MKTTLVFISLMGFICKSSIGANAVLSITPWTVATNNPMHEPFAAVHPLASQVVMLTAFDASVLLMPRCWISSNGGTTWLPRSVPYETPAWTSQGLLKTADGSRWWSSGDVVGTFDREGRAFLVAVYCAQDGTSDTALYVSSATAASGWLFQSNDTHRVTRFSRVEDKPWLAVDNTTSPFSGRVYVAWRRSEGTPARTKIVLSRSLDHGASWSTLVQASLAAHETNGAMNAAQIGIGPAGQLFVVYNFFPDRTAATNQLFVSVSEDGGASFSSATPVTPFFGGPSRGSSFSMLSTSAEGRLHIVYAARNPNTNGIFPTQGEIYYVRSTNSEGTRFTAPTVISPTYPLGQGDSQVIPAVSVGADGVVHVIWHDFVGDPFPGPYHFNIRARYSLDGGATFSPSAIVTPTPALYDPNNTREYIGVASGGGYAYPVWIASGEVHAARLELPVMLAVRRVSAGVVGLSWPTSPPGYRLQRIAAVGMTNWVEVTTSVVTNNDFNEVILPSGSSSGFFRLTKAEGP